jgi:fatty acid desaturase
MNTPLEAPAPDFFADPYQHYRKSLLSIGRLRELSRLRPARVVIDTLWCWGWILAAWTAVALWPAWWTALLAVPVIGSRYYALFIIGHDGIHRRLFARRSVNDLFNDLFILGPIGAITRINGKNHLNHHHYLATARDPDRHKYGSYNKTQAHELVGYLSGVTSVLRSIRHVFFARHAGAPPGTALHPGYALRDGAILLGWQLLLMGGLTVAVGWWAFPVLWLLPFYLFTFLADNFRSFAEHSHPAPDIDSDEHRLITYVSNPLERLLVAPMNMNYHAVHHLYPSIPYYHLPEADREVRRSPAAEGMVWRGSYLGYLRRYFGSLPLGEVSRPAVAARREEKLAPTATLTV